MQQLIRQSCHSTQTYVIVNNFDQIHAILYFDQFLTHMMLYDDFFHTRYIDVPKFEFSAIIVHTEKCGHVVSASFQGLFNYICTLTVNDSDIVRSKRKSNHVNAPESIK